MNTHPTVLRFEQLMSLLKAWAEDDRLEKGWRDKDKTSQVAPVLGAMLEALVTSIQEEGKSWNKSMREQMRGLFAKYVSSSGGNANWSQRHALARLESQVFKNKKPGFFEQALELALLEAGCWEDIPARGVSAVKNEDKFSPYGSFMTSVNEASQNNKAEVLERLLDWEGSGARCAPLLLSKGTGRGMSAAMNGQATGWAWTVRNASPECLDIWLKAGADPNAQDKKSGPVLAYAATDTAVQQMLKAGADPLGMHLPYAVRHTNFDVLWEGWKSSLHHQLRATAFEQQQFAAAEQYLRSRFAKWSEDEACQTLTPQLYSMYCQGAVKKKETNDQLPTIRFLSDLARVEDFSALRIDQCGLTLSFPGALAHATLTGIGASEEKAGTFVWTGLKTQARDEEIAPGVNERDIAALIDFHFNPNPAKELLKSVSAKRLTSTFSLLYAHAQAHSASNTARLNDVFVVFLAQRNMTTSKHLQAQAPGLIDVYLDQLSKQAALGAYHLGPVMAWMNRFGQHVPLEQKARWAALTLVDYDGLKASTRQLALSTLTDALKAGWSPPDESEDAVLANAVTKSRQTHVAVDSFFKAQALEQVWAEPAPPRAKTPRF